MSLVEAAANVIVGYVLSIATQIVVFALFEIEVALQEHLAIGLAFTGVSLIRGYVLRRVFERIMAANRFGGHAEHEEPALHHR
jgi:hypothetical protein